MNRIHSYRLFGAAILAFALAACSSGGSSFRPSVSADGGQTGGGSNPSNSSASTDRTTDVALTANPQNVSVALDGGYSSTVNLSADRSVTVKVRGRVLAQTPGTRSAQSVAACPLYFGSIAFTNPFSFPIPLKLRAVTIESPCALGTTTYDIAIAQTAPSIGPATVLGQVSAAGGKKLTFTPSTATFTLPAHGTFELLIYPHTTSGAPPTIYTAPTTGTPPGEPQDLTGGHPIDGPGGIEKLYLGYDSSSGGTYSSTCYDARKPPGSTILSRQPVLGTAKYFCVVQPLGADITFGNSTTSVHFGIDGWQADPVVFVLDGTPRNTPCDTSQPRAECDTTQFSTAQYRNLIYSNVQDMTVCDDGNKCVTSATPSPTSTSTGPVVTSSKRAVQSHVAPPAPTPALRPAPAQKRVLSTTRAPLATTIGSPPPACDNGEYVSANCSFELLIANDPTYHTPSYGGYSVTVLSEGERGQGCSIDHSPTNPGIALGLVPAGYTGLGKSDESSTATKPAGAYDFASYPNAGPNSAVYIHTSARGGWCQITVTELTGLQRSATYQSWVYGPRIYSY